MKRDNEATASPEAMNAGEDEPQTVALARVRMLDLLKRPFDIRSIALTGLFILAVFYTVYFMRAVLLPLILALLRSGQRTVILAAMDRISMARGKLPRPHQPATQPVAVDMQSGALSA